MAPPYPYHLNSLSTSILYPSSSSLPSLSYRSRSQYPHPPYQLLTRRGAQEALTPNQTQKVTLIVGACYIFIIGILWHVPILNKVIYPFKLLVVRLHEMSHALAGILTCATVESIQLDPDEGGVTTMRGGVPAITLPAGYLGSSFIGACLIACGFDTNASKVATCVLGFLFLITLWWARKSWISWLTILFMVGLLVLFWLVANSIALRFFILFIGVMSCFYSVWDIIDDTIARKVNSSDASEFAAMMGCCGSRVWGVFWLMVSIMFFIGGVLVGIAVFKDTAAEQAAAAKKFMGGTP